MKLNALRDLLKGRKTYITAAAAAVTALAAFADGSLSDVQLITALYEAAAACTLRAGIANLKTGGNP